MSNYRELFERLAKCQLPAGVEIFVHDAETYGYAAVHSKNREIKAYPTYDKPHECRAALMLIVDAMRKRGWRFSSFDFRADDGSLGFDIDAEVKGVVRGARQSPDEVTAIAECLIAALGVAE